MVPDLAKIAEDCGIESCTDSSVVVEAINKLEKIYESDDLIIIYGYLIKHSLDLNVLSHLIKCIDKIRYNATLDLLMDIVLLHGIYSGYSKKDEAVIKVRVLAIKAVCNLKDTRAVSGLLQCLNDKDENYKIRLSCADALGRIGDKYAVMPLIDVVSDENEKSSYVRESAVTALGMIGDTRAVDSLVSILETKNGIIDKFTFLKERVIEALGKFNFSNDRVIKAFKNSLMDESPQVRINGIEALMNSEHEQAFDLIKSMLNDSDEEVVKNAVIALYNINGRGILDEIIQGEYSFACKEQAQFIIDEYESDDEC